MAGKAVKKAVERHLVDDLKGIWKRWSTWIMTLMISAQACWAMVPQEARQLLPKPEILGLVLGAAAIVATMFKQGNKDNGNEDQ